MRIRIFGDRHGDIEELLKPTDLKYSLVLGDFGVSGKQLQKLNKHLEETNHILFFVDGNHEQYNKMNHLKTIDMFGGRVGVYAKNIFWLKRGEVYEINGKKILTFGGAYSIDRIYRTEKVDWFPEEEYSEEEYERLSENIQKHNYQFD